MTILYPSHQKSASCSNRMNHKNPQTNSFNRLITQIPKTYCIQHINYKWLEVKASTPRPLVLRSRPYLFEAKVKTTHYNFFCPGGWGQFSRTQPF